MVSLKLTLSHLLTKTMVLRQWYSKKVSSGGIKDWASRPILNPSKGYHGASWMETPYVLKLNKRERMLKKNCAAFVG